MRIGASVFFPFVSYTIYVSAVSAASGTHRREAERKSNDVTANIPIFV